jgi:hypothetical protein
MSSKFTSILLAFMLGTVVGWATPAPITTVDAGTLSVTVPDAKDAEIATAFEAVQGRLQGETAANMMRRHLRAHIVDVVRIYRRRTAIQAAEAGIVNPTPVEFGE